MSGRQYDLTIQQKCPLLPPQNIPYAVQDDFSSTADETSANVLDPGAANDEIQVTQRSVTWKLRYHDFVPSHTNNWNKSETFQ